MRALIQRVSKASVKVDGKIIGEINKGLVVLLGVNNNDNNDTAGFLANKIINLRIFEDESGKFNLSAMDLGAEILAISQFTLYADCRRGRRPGFTEAAHPDISEPLYNQFIQLLKTSGLKVETGQFGAHMLVEIHNDGPVTIMLDSDEKR
ncbi:D-tyrosyl-tRNA(Tyr) deacylase [candidate division KSB1 bacterium]|nr:D-tyrosyl-tRNA(Tyr) deacylase [candidate division KSB1 bacterium]